MNAQLTGLARERVDTIIPSHVTNINIHNRFLCSFPFQSIFYKAPIRVIAMSPLPTSVTCTRANTVQELAELCDENFVNSVYLTLLNRMPDPAGFETFLSRVRRGDDKLRIIWDISQSQEGRLKNIRLMGLITQRNRWRATASRLREIWFKLSGIQAVERRFRAAENDFGVRLAEINETIRVMNVRIANLNQALNENSQVFEGVRRVVSFGEAIEGAVESAELMGPEIHPDLSNNVVVLKRYYEKRSMTAVALDSIKQWPLGKRING